MLRGPRHAEGSRTAQGRTSCAKGMIMTPNTQTRGARQRHACAPRRRRQCFRQSRSQDSEVRRVGGAAARRSTSAPHTHGLVRPLLGDASPWGAPASPAAPVLARRATPTLGRGLRSASSWPSTNGPQENFGSLRHAAACCGMLQHASSCWLRVPAISKSGTGFKNQTKTQ